MEDTSPNACPSCGSDVDADAAFCSECGANLSDTATPPQNDAEGGSGYNIRWKMLVTAVGMSLLIGFFAAWATLTLNVAGPAFFIALIGGTYFLYRKKIPSEAIGSGLYITALVMILTPLLFYLPTVFSGSETGGAAGAGMVIGSILGLVIWGFVFLLFAVVTAAVGYFFKRRASRKRGTTAESP